MYIIALYNKSLEWTVDLASKYLSIEVSQKLLYTCLIFNLEISNEMNYPRSRQAGQEV